MTILWFLILGALAGWMAGNMMRGGGFGVIGNIIVGVLGSLIGGHLLSWFGVGAGGLVGSLATALLGAVVLLFIVGLIKK